MPKIISIEEAPTIDPFNDTRVLPHLNTIKALLENKHTQTIAYNHIKISIDLQNYVGKYYGDLYIDLQTKQRKYNQTVHLLRSS